MAIFTPGQAYQLRRLARERIDQLVAMDENGTLTDKRRGELQELRAGLEILMRDTDEFYHGSAA